jgi:hypothetical protein
MMRVMLLVLLLAAPSSFAFASDEDPDRNLRILLFSHHGPPAAEVFERTVPNARARILAIASDDRANAALRDRALIALGGFGGEDVRRLYDRILADRTMRTVARVHVLAAYTKAFPAQARVVLERAKTSEEASLRTAATQQLRTLPRER